MTHSPLSWGSQTRNETHHWLLLRVVLLEPIRSHFLVLPSDFSNHHNTLSLRVDNKLLKDVNEVGAVKGISSNADNSALSESSLSGLINCLIGQSAGSADNSYFSSFVDIAWHDAYLALQRLDDTGAVGTNHSCFGLGSQNVLHPNHVLLGDTWVMGAVPSVMTTQSQSSASTASMMASAAPGGGTQMTEA